MLGNERLCCCYCCCCRTSGNSFSNSLPPAATVPPSDTRPSRPSPSGTPSHSNHNSSPSRGRDTDYGGSGGKSSKVTGAAVAGIVISLVVVCALVGFFLIKRKSVRCNQGGDPEKNEHLSPLASGKIKRKSIMTSTSKKFYSTRHTGVACLSYLNYGCCSELRPIRSILLSPTGKELKKIVSMNLKPPSKIELHKSNDENNPKPVVKKVNLSSIRATAYTVADLQVATGSFSADNLVGEGSFGRVYRAQLSDQKVCSVNFIRQFSFQR